MEWVNLEQEQLFKESDESVSNPTFNLYLSPFDTPEAVRAHLDEENSKGIIEFRYLGRAEPLKEKEVDNNVTFMVGKKSGRLYQIIMPESYLSEGGYKVTINLHELDQAIDTYKNNVTSKIGSLNAIKEVLHSHSSEIGFLATG